MDQDVRQDGLLQGGLEGLHQAVGEVPDEAHGVRGQEAAARGVEDAAGRGVQGGEELVLRQGVGVRDRVEEAGLPGVRVAHHRRPGQARPLPAPPLDRALHPDLLEVLLDVPDPCLDLAPVQLQGLFAGSLGAVASALLAHQVLPGMGQPGQGVLELGELHLEARLPGQGPTRENLQDQLAAVVDHPARVLLPVPLLDRGEGVVEDEGIRVLGLGGSDEFLDLARGQQVGGRAVPDPDQDPPRLLDPLGLRQAREFGQEAVRLVLGDRVGLYSDEQRAFRARRGFRQFGHVHPSGRPSGRIRAASIPARARIGKRAGRPGRGSGRPAAGLHPPRGIARTLSLPGRGRGGTILPTSPGIPYRPQP